MTRHVLVIEDDADIAMLARRHLEDLSCRVNVACDGVSGLHEAQYGGYDLIILDLTLPGIDGVEIAHRLRTASNDTPILMLTARAGERERMRGLESGADDYLAKPFAILELQARVNAIFLRMTASHSATPQEPAVICVGDLTIDPSHRVVTLRGAPVTLSRNELDLLLHLARNPGRAHSRAELLQALWGPGHEGCEYAFNRHLNRLRSKIEDDLANPRYVLSVRGTGYMFTSAEPAGRR